jgi:hypothetical protein
LNRHSERIPRIFSPVACCEVLQSFEHLNFGFVSYFDIRI